MRPDDVGLGGFDSHTLPPAGAVLRAAALLLCLSTAAFAQKPDSLAKPVPADSAGPAQGTKRVLKP